jgi:uncharacterized transporter YbjL
MTRGLTVVSTLEQLNGSLSEEQKYKATILGWCIELVTTHCIIILHHMVIKLHRTWLIGELIGACSCKRTFWWPMI